MGEKWVDTVCRMCFTGCGIRVKVEDGVVTKIEGNPNSPINWGKICPKGQAGLMTHYNPKRVMKPLKRGNPEKGIGVDPKWIEITWEEAMDIVVDRIKEVYEDDPRKIVFLCLDHHLFSTGFLVPWFFALRTPNYFAGGAGVTCGGGQHQASALIHGSFVTVPDLDYCNYLILMGTQFAHEALYCLPNYASRLADARERGMKLVVVDPVGTKTASKADEWLPIRPGTDGALALCMINLLINEFGIYDREFIKNHTNGTYLINKDGYYIRDKESGKPLVWDLKDGSPKTHDREDIGDLAIEGSYDVYGEEGVPAFQLIKEHVKGYTEDKVSEITAIPREKIRRIAKEFGEAARIGSNIDIRGKKLPYRPASVLYFKGAQGHKHALHTSLAIELLNVIVGAIDVPGGCLGSSPAGPFWSPQIGEDGLIVPGYVTLPHPYPARQVRPPQSYILEELFPIACETSHIFVETIRNPEKYKFSYKPEILIHYYCNAMKNTGNPEMVADALKKIPFQMSISLWIDETAEFADIIFPDTSYLERLDPFPNVHTAWVPVGLDNPHTWQLRKPVVDPPEGVRPAVETLFEIAERVGFLSDYYAIFNEASFSGTKIPLKEQYKLDPSKKYSWEEIVDRQAKSMFGEEHGLEWFKEHGLITIPKKVSDIYMPFGKAKIQIYFEYLRRVGEEVDKVTKECGIDWDISDYTPLVDWKPCPAYEPDGEYNLFAVNYKTVYHTFAATQNNAWLEEVAEDDPYAYKIMIHREVAKKRGIKDNDIVSVESKWGGVKGRAVITDFIYPEAIGIAGSYGSWVASGKGVDYNRLIPIDLEHTDYVSCNIDLCVRVKLSKI